jgi:hypothetical protein
MKPQSHLTRQLFRALIANQPYHAASCPLSILAARRSAGPARRNYVQKRGLFGLSLGTTARKEYTEQRATPKNVENALIKLSDFIYSQRSRSRPPSDNDLAAALRYLVNSKIDQRRTMTRNEVYLVTEAFKYLVGQSMVLSPDNLKALGHDDLVNLLRAMALPECKEEVRSDSIELADLVKHSAQQSLVGIREAEALLLESYYVSILASSGAATRAMEAFQRSELAVTDSSLLADTYEWQHNPHREALHSTLSGLYAEGLRDDFWSLAERQLSADQGLANFLIRHLCVRGDANAAWTMWQKNNWSIGKPIQPATAAILLRSLASSDVVDMSNPLASEVGKRIDDQEMAGSVLMWNLACGATVQDIERLVHVAAANGVNVGIAEINPVIELAYAKRNSILAEQIIQLTQRIGLAPDAETYAYKLDYEISTGDVFAAQSTFETLSIQDVPMKRADIPVLNRYVAALTSTPDPDVPLIMRVVDRIQETDGSLNTDSLASLSLVFLQRRELEEVMNILRYRIEYLPAQDRAQIAQVFQTFIVDLNIKDQRAFEAYELFRSAFPETFPTERLVIMDSFFARRRSDLACLVFGHMRQREELEHRPNDAAYAQCFYGIASCRDVDGLQMVYNMLKMDVHVEQTTKVHNAMMAAYAACQTPFRAIIDHYWKILDSREGPTLSTFMLALRACETWIGAGGEEARRIMAVMQKFNLIIAKDVYHCYIGALAGQSQFENCIELIENMEADIGEPPDATTIGTFYNAIPWQYRKDEVETWAKNMYPELWEELVSYGDEIDEEWDVRYFNVNRDIDVDDEPIFSQGRYTPALAEQARLGLPAPQSTD